MVSSFEFSYKQRYKWAMRMQQTLLQMRAAYLQESRVKSLKDQIFETVMGTKFQSVTNLLRKTRRREHSKDPPNSYHSDHPHSAQSSIPQSSLQRPRFSLSPPFHSRLKGSVPRSTDCMRSAHKQSKGNPTINVIFKGCKNHTYLLSVPKRGGSLKEYSSESVRRLKIGKNQRRRADCQSRSRSKPANSRDRGGQLNLSSILEQESSESKLVTPSSKADKSRYRQGRRLSGDRTKKKDRKNLKDIVWRRLERCLKQPEKFHRLLKSDIVGVRFRILRKTLLEIEIHTGRQMQALRITLHKGNLETQSIQQFFPRLEANSTFSFYSSVRSVDLNQPFRLPQLLIQGSLLENNSFSKVITLPYCWLHISEEPRLRQTRGGRIKTKTCLQDMACSRLALKSLMAVLPGWGCQSAGRGWWVWDSRMLICEHEFQFRVVQREGRFMGELCGRGEQRLMRMLQFLQELLC